MRGEFESNQKHRRSVRLDSYDYRAGTFFITLCTFERINILGTILEQGVVLSRLGEIVTEEWRRTAQIRPEVELDDFVVMPNHLHAIVTLSSGGIDGPTDAGSAPGDHKFSAQQPSLGAHGCAPLQAASGSIARGARPCAPTAAASGSIAWVSCGGV